MSSLAVLRIKIVRLVHMTWQKRNCNAQCALKCCLLFQELVHALTTKPGNVYRPPLSTVTCNLRAYLPYVLACLIAHLVQNVAVYVLGSEQAVCGEREAQLLAFVAATGESQR